MAVSSPHPHQLPNPGTWARGSRWPKGDTQGGLSDNQPSDGTWCTDFGNLTIDSDGSSRKIHTGVSGSTLPGAQRKRRLRSG